ncbi:MAG: radical SAM protein [Dehalococcoidales bacterium]|nr:radical SAM protein [Dehalococcoidales bacterium]
MKKILLIQPPFYSFMGLDTRYFPYHLVCIGTYLKANDYDVRVVEGDLAIKRGSLKFTDIESGYRYYLESLADYDHPSWVALQREIEEYTPDIIGISVWTSGVASAVRTAELARRAAPQALIVVGGPHITLKPDDVVRMSAVDIGVVGEGERTMLEIADGVEPGTINGVVIKKEGKLIRTPERDFEERLDAYGMPDRSLLRGEGLYDEEDMGLVMTSRGCPYACAYCATTIWKRRMRCRSVEAVIDEMKSVKSRYGTTYFTIKDDTFTVDRHRVEDFCNALKVSGMRIVWECNGNLNTLDAGMLAAMKDAGCVGIKVGVETGSDRIHRIINKGLTNDIVRKKIRLIKESGLHVTCYFMMGIPGEAKQDVIDTIEFATTIKPDYISASVYEIFPGTALHAVGVERGEALNDMQFDDYFSVYPHNYYCAKGRRELAGMSGEHFDDLERMIKRKVDKYNRSMTNVYARVRSRCRLYRISAKYLIRDMHRFIRWW